jgi:phosphoribosyl 1,2-cyclic phosphodiesterase
MINIGDDIQNVKAIFVTHEHTDHIKCISTLLKNLKIPLVCSEGTLNALALADKIPKGTEVITENGFFVADIKATRFSTSHDSLESSGYTFCLPTGEKVGICTDLGIVTDEVRNALTGVNTLLFESNHDIEMLRRGPYPPELKLRIMSDKGHLSNNACATELKHFLKNGTTRFILGHLSQHNNLPALAQSSARAALMDIGAVENRDYRLNIAKPSSNEVIYI